MREFELLLHCARSRPDPDRIEELVDRGIDWRRLVGLAERNAVRPLLFRSLKSACWRSVPATIQVELEDFDRANIRKSLLFTGELLRLSSAFQRNGVAFAAFKGVALAQALYGDPASREFVDLDILVQESDLHDSEAVLAACGYRAAFQDRDYRSAFLSYHGQYGFYHRDAHVSVDLHWQLSGSGVAFPLQAKEIWRGLTEVTICGRKIPTFGRDELALFLAAHGTKEGWRSLVWVCDFAEFVHQNRDIDWERLLDRARRAHSSRSLLLAVFLASTLLDVCVSEKLLEEARRTPQIRALADEARNGLLGAAPVGQIAALLKKLDTHDRLIDRFIRVAKLVARRTVSDYQAVPLPANLWGFYWFLRPFRLAGKLARLIKAEAA